jgi:hypothetical protein
VQDLCALLEKIGLPRITRNALDGACAVAPCPLQLFGGKKAPKKTAAQEAHEEAEAAMAANAHKAEEAAARPKTPEPPKKDIDWDAAPPEKRTPKTSRPTSPSMEHLSPEERALKRLGKPDKLTSVGQLKWKHKEDEDLGGHPTTKAEAAAEVSVSDVMVKHEGQVAALEGAVKEEEASDEAAAASEKERLRLEAEEEARDEAAEAARLAALALAAAEAEQLAAEEAHALLEVEAEVDPQDDELEALNHLHDVTVPKGCASIGHQPSFEQRC